MSVIFIVFLLSCVLVIGTPFTLHYLLYRTSLSERFIDENVPSLDERVHRLRDYIERQRNHCNVKDLIDWDFGR